MRILGFTLYGFGLRFILLAIIGFIVVVAIQMYQYGLSVDKTEQQLFTAWPDKADVALYIENCVRRPVSRKETDNNDRPFGKYACARKYVSEDLAIAIEEAHESIPDPSAPLKYL